MIRRKNYHLLITSVLAIVLSFAFSSNQTIAQAETEDEEVELIVEEFEDDSEDIKSLYSYQTEDGETHVFFSEEDKQSFIDSLNQTQDDGDITPNHGITTRQTQIDSTTREDEFLGYHSQTPNWAYADNYSLSNTHSFTLSTNFSYRGVSTTAQFGIQTGVLTSIPANPDFRSRLGIVADVEIGYMLNEVILGTEVIDTFYSLRTTVQGVETVQPVYHPDYN